MFSQFDWWLCRMLCWNLIDFVLKYHEIYTKLINSSPFWCSFFLPCEAPSVRQSVPPVINFRMEKLHNFPFNLLVWLGFDFLDCFLENLTTTITTAEKKQQYFPKPIVSGTASNFLGTFSSFDRWMKTSIINFDS